MANILIIDDQKWVKELYEEGLQGEAHTVSATDDVERVMKNVFSFNSDIVLLNLYLKHGFLAWDVLRDIKTQDPNLPVLIVTAYDNFLFDSRLSQADGYLIKNPCAVDELKQKVSLLLDRSAE